MTHEFKLIPRDESIVVREDEMIEAAVAVLKTAEPETVCINWPDPLDQEQIDFTAAALARRTGLRIGRKTKPAEKDGLRLVEFRVLGEPKPRKAQEKTAK